MATPKGIGKARKPARPRTSMRPNVQVTPRTTRVPPAVARATRYRRPR